MHPLRGLKKLVTDACSIEAHIQNLYKAEDFIKRANGQDFKPDFESCCESGFRVARDLLSAIQKRQIDRIKVEAENL